jgi:DNA adenine methylase
MPEPFLKWAGGKRWLIQRHRDLFPTDYVRYVEPFLGGGAVFLGLLPKRALLADSNEELINAYRCVRSAPVSIDLGLRSLQKRHTSRTYYRIRAMGLSEPVPRAIRFIYLNRTCFNGLYRVNRQGEFNVPIGTKTQVEYPGGYLDEVSRALHGAELHVADFECILDKAGDGDFVFLDPPYTAMHNANNFIKYNAALFSWQDQLRLAAAAQRAASRGAAVMVTNADHAAVRSLFRELGTQHTVERASVLASKAAYRRPTTELIVTSY